MNKIPKLAASAGLILLTAALNAQHGHLDAGASGKNQGDALVFLNGGDFAASSGYTKVLTLATSGRFAGYYEGGITPTAVHGLNDPDQPPTYLANPNASALGSFLQMAIVSVSGPAGGSFQFWEGEATAPTYSYSVGYNAVLPGDLFPLSDVSEGAGTVGGDPYGHLHGRRFTTDLPGDYTVGFRMVDTSVNGAGGAPIHSPSDVLSIQFSSVVPEPTTLALAAAGLALLGFMMHRRR